ncbi:MAG: DUF134 domain-containing protein [Lachnotalea sp.]
MPRPRKCRRICSMPQTDGFEPINGKQITYDEVILNLDEYEVIRLIDFEKLTQEQCAAQMIVSRTTVTSIYEAARFKMADAFINGKKLIIDGGKFRLCEHNKECCGKGCKNNCFIEKDTYCQKENCKQ